MHHALCLSNHISTNVVSFSFQQFVFFWNCRRVGCGKLAYKGRVKLFVTFNAGATYACSSCNRRIWLLEFFIHKISNEKNGDRQAPPLPPQKRRTPTYKKTKQNKNKTGKGGGRAWPRSHPVVRSGYEITLDLTQAGWLLRPLLKSSRSHCSEFKTKKHKHKNWNSIVIEALYTCDIFA